MSFYGSLDSEWMDSRVHQHQKRIKSTIRYNFANAIGKKCVAKDKVNYCNQRNYWTKNNYYAGNVFVAYIHAWLVCTRERHDEH